jgi:hypothetical protein
MFTYLFDRHPRLAFGFAFSDHFPLRFGKGILPNKSASAALLLDFGGGGESPRPPAEHVF